MDDGVSSGRKEGCCWFKLPEAPEQIRLWYRTYLYKIDLCGSFWKINKVYFFKNMMLTRLLMCNDHEGTD